MGHYKKTTQWTTLSGESELLYHVELLSTLNLNYSIWTTLSRTTQLIYLELTTIVKDICTTEYSILLRPHKQRFNRFFLFDPFLITVWLLINNWLFINLKMTTEWAFFFFFLNSVNILFDVLHKYSSQYSKPFIFFLCI